MFNFTSDKLENKFINIMNIGWIGDRVGKHPKGVTMFRFESSDGFVVFAAYNRKGKLVSINGGETGLMKFISETEESDAAHQLLSLMLRRKFISTYK
jgi:hypothetical protein